MSQLKKNHKLLPRKEESRKQILFSWRKKMAVIHKKGFFTLFSEIVLQILLLKFRFIALPAVKFTCEPPEKGVFCIISKLFQLHF